MLENSRGRYSVDENVDKSEYTSGSRKDDGLHRSRAANAEATED